MATDAQSWAVLTARTQGQFPLSIPTSLALESAVGVLPDAPTDSPEIRKRNLLMVNIRTLFRNLMGSIDSEKKHDLNVQTLAQTLANEIRTIEALVAEHSDGRCDTQFYHCSYADLLRHFNRSILKSPTTPGQQWQAAMEHSSLETLIKEFAGSNIQQYVREFPEVRNDALIMTHYPIDLLQRYRFGALALLESHTGAIKPPMLWNTKLYNGRELERIPFDRMTLQLFGDGVTFAPMPSKIRKRMIEIAEESKWTPATTKAYVISCVESARDPALEVLVKELYRK